jgi:hypothetical protein
MTPVTLCLAASHEQVERIVERLRADDIQEILVLLHHQGAVKGDVQVPAIAGLTQLNTPPANATTATGALTGAAIGGLTTSTGLVIPFIWPIIFAVLPLATAAGAVIGALAGMAIGVNNRKEELQVAREFGIPEGRLADYRKRLDAGDYLVAVHAVDEAHITRAKDIFEELGAQHVEVFR